MLADTSSETMKLESKAVVGMAGLSQTAHLRRTHESSGEDHVLAGNGGIQAIRGFL